MTLYQNPGTTNFGGSVCDITNYTPACIFEVQGTQASSTAVASPSTYTGLGTMQRNALTGPG